MKDEEIERIRSAVESADHIPAEKKTELLRLLSKLKPTIAKASETHQDQAEKIGRLVEASTHEATKRKPDAVKKLVRELEQVVEKFEASHPELVASVTEYSALLSALGI
jgi:ferritin-like metal-binding protein YciE